MSAKLNSHRSWRDLTGGQQFGLLVTTALQLALTGVAVRDIARRPKDKIRGSKVMWSLVSFVNFIGPVSYFLFGRRK